MKHFHQPLWGIVAILGIALSSSALARTVYLNGVDISSARNQTLKKVNLRIDERGNLFIEAPHYQVNEETTFTPLSSYLHQSARQPMHEKRRELPKELSEVGATKKLPDLQDKEINTPATQGGEAPSAVENHQPKLQDKEGKPTGDGE